MSDANEVEAKSLDSAAVAARVGCHVVTLRRMVAANQFPRPFFVGEKGGAPRWRVEDVENWIAAGGVPSTRKRLGTRVVEVRSGAPAELRRRRTMRRDGLNARFEGGRKVLSGYGAVFYRAGDPGTEYELSEGVFERINPRAFDRTLREDKDIFATFNHDDNKLLGRTTAGTLRLTVDAVGLRYEIDLPDTPTGAEVFALASRGDLCGSSFSFYPVQSAQRTEDGRQVIERLDVLLRELGPVVNPAYSGTTTAAAVQRDRDMIAVQLEVMRMDEQMHPLASLPGREAGRLSAQCQALTAAAQRMEIDAVLASATPRCGRTRTRSPELRCPDCGGNERTCPCD